MASSNDGMGSYGHLSQSENTNMGASLVAPDPEDLVQPASAVVRCVLAGCVWMNMFGMVAFVDCQKKAFFSWFS